jgi:hypothetical protein
MRIEFLTAWLLILGSYTTATGQMGVPATSFRPDGKAGSFSSTEQSEKDESHQALARARRTLLTATKVLVVREPFSYSSSKAERAFRKAFLGTTVDQVTAPTGNERRLGSRGIVLVSPSTERMNARRKAVPRCLRVAFIFVSRYLR